MADNADEEPTSNDVTDPNDDGDEQTPTKKKGKARRAGKKHQRHKQNAPPPPLSTTAEDGDEDNAETDPASTGDAPLCAVCSRLLSTGHQNVNQVSPHDETSSSSPATTDPTITPIGPITPSGPTLRPNERNTTPEEQNPTRPINSNRNATGTAPENIYRHPNYRRRSA